MAYVLKYIAEGEHQQQDFKVRVDDSRKIAKTLVSFANTDGGRLLIGVKDNGKVCGCRSSEEIHMIQAAAELYCQPQVPFETQLWQVDGLHVLEVVVEPSVLRPHFATNENSKKRAYFRKGDRNRVANGVMLKVWQRAHDIHEGNFEYDEEKEKLFEKFHTRDKLGFRAISRITKLNSSQTEDLLAQLISWGILEMELDGRSSSFHMVEPETESERKRKG